MSGLLEEKSLNVPLKANSELSVESTTLLLLINKSMDGRQLFIPVVHPVLSNATVNTSPAVNSRSTS